MTDTGIEIPVWLGWVVAVALFLALLIPMLRAFWRADREHEKD